ncbi:class I adenylate-forming enzyme family protein [Bordetella sp. 15P40C-2]|uniref:class I adenylate-forming enzyme family protein n=1 Tax=Bordetella sp. 15P40C-2 TaxID=2572246 RepID=UPI001325CA3E|nr:AMP-binding protein [Bordetella sp. 15P40C-2]MVW70321.1 AMP-binding protein [Bordetella sp. 15P40C-2]
MAAKKLSPQEVVALYPAHDYSLSSLLQSRIAAVPNKSFLEYEDQRWTYAEFGQTVDQTAAWLRKRGLKAGDRLGVFSQNHPTTVILLFAVAKIGAIMVPLNPDFGVSEARYALSNAEVSGIVCSPRNWQRAQEACREMSPQPWIVLNQSDDNAIGVPAMGDEITPTDAIPADEASGDATCLFIYTSGTTGSPKAAMHGQRGVVLTAEGFVVRMHLQPDERALCVLPLFHINALFYSVGGTLAAGATLVLSSRFSASTFWSVVHETRATTCNLIGAAASILIKRDRSEFRPGHCMTKMFIAPLDENLVRVFNDEFGVRDLIECYGMTEIPGAISNPFPGPRKLGSMGRISPHLSPDYPQPQLKVVNEQFEEVGIGEHGILLVRTPTVMQGYYRDAERTADAFHDGWFITGDLVWRDADDFYWFVARQRDVIRCRGENIAGAELDRVISAHPDVLEAAVIGVPAELGEEDIFAVVVARPEKHPTAEDIGQWVAQQLAPIKIPRYVAFVEALPKTPTQRVEKFKLKADSQLFKRATKIQIVPHTTRRGDAVR